MSGRAGPARDLDPRTRFPGRQAKRDKKEQITALRQRRNSHSCLRGSHLDRRYSRVKSIACPSGRATSIYHTDERLIKLDIECHDDTQFLSLCYDTCMDNGYSYASVFNGRSYPTNDCSCHKSCNSFETVVATDRVWATAVPTIWPLINGGAKASPRASTFDAAALTCDTYKHWPVDDMGLHVIRCEGKDACKEDPPTRLNAGIDQLGTLLVCDGEKACADSLFFLDGSGPALPVVALCCGEGACEGNYQFDVWPLTGVDAYGYCKGKDACKGSGASWFVAEGNTLTMDCDGSEDGTCEDATFRVGSGPARCTGGGASNAERGSCVGPAAQLCLRLRDSKLQADREGLPGPAA